MQSGREFGSNPAPGHRMHQTTAQTGTTTSTRRSNIKMEDVSSGSDNSSDTEDEIIIKNSGEKNRPSEKNNEKNQRESKKENNVDADSDIEEFNRVKTAPQDDYQIFSHAHDNESDADWDDDDDQDRNSERFKTYDEGRAVLLQLYTQNKLQNIDIWDWGFGSKLHHFILTPSDETMKTSTTGQTIDFGEKAQLIDATATIYGYKVQNLYDQALKLAEKNGFGGSESTNQSDESNTKAKREKKVTLPPTLESPDNHNQSEMEVIHAYNVVFTEATKALATSVGIRTLLCYNTKLNADGVNMICDLDKDPYDLCPRLDRTAEVTKFREKALRLESQFSVIQVSNSDKRLGPGASEQEQVEYKSLIALIEIGQADERKKQANINARLETLASSDFTLTAAVDINQTLPPALILQKERVQKMYESLSGEEKRNYVAPLPNIMLDPSLQMMLFDLNKKEEHYNKVLKMSGNSDQSLRDLLSGNMAVNTDVLSTAVSLNADGDDEEDGGSTAVVSRGRKKEIDPAVLNAHAERVLFTSLGLGKDRNNRFGDDDDDIDGDFNHGNHSHDDQNHYYLLCKDSNYPIPFSKRTVLSALAQTIGKKKTSSTISKSLLSPLSHANIDLVTTTFSTLQTTLDNRVEYDEGIFQSGVADIDDKRALIKKEKQDKKTKKNAKVSIEEEREQLLAKLKTIPAENRHPINTNYYKNTQIDHIIAAPFDDRYAYTHPFPIPSTKQSKSGPKKRRSQADDEEVKEESHDMGPKRRNLFDFSLFSVGKMNYLPGALEGQEDHDDFFLNSQQHDANQQFRRSIDLHVKNDLDFLAELDRIEGRLNDNDMVALGDDQLKVVGGNQRTKHVSSGPIALDIDELGLNDVYDQGDMLDFFNQHDQLVQEQFQAQEQRRNKVDGADFYVNKGQSAEQLAILEKIRNGQMDDFDSYDNYDNNYQESNNNNDNNNQNDENFFEKEARREEIKNRRIDAARRLTASLTGVGDNPNVLDIEPQQDYNYSSSLNTLLTETFLPAPKIQIKNIKRHTNMGDNDDDSNNNNNNNNNVQEEKKLSLIQLNMLRKQRHTHRLYQQMLQERTKAEDGGNKRKKSKQQIDDDSDAGSENEEKKPKRVTKRAQKINTIDISAILKSDQPPMTPGVQMYIQGIQSFVPAKGSKSKDYDPQLTLVASLDKTNFDNYSRLASRSTKKLTAKQTTFLHQHRLLFSPTPELELATFREHVGTLSTPNPLQASMSGAGSASALASQQKHLMPRFVSSKNSFLQPLVSLMTRPNVTFPIQIPSTSYASQTNLDVGTFVNIVRKKQIFSTNHAQISQNQKQLLLIKQREQEKLQNQEAMRHVIASMATRDELGIAEGLNVLEKHSHVQNRQNDAHGSAFHRGNHHDGHIHDYEDDNNDFNNDFLNNTPTKYNGDDDDDDDDDLPELVNDDYDDDDDIGKGLPDSAGVLDFTALQKILDDQNTLMLQKGSETDDFISRLQQNDDFGDIDDDNDGLLNLAGGLAGQNPFGMNKADPFSYHTQLAMQNEAFNDDPFKTKLYDDKKDDGFKLSISKYFNMRQLKMRILGKVTKPTLQRVRLLNFRQLAKKKIDSIKNSGTKIEIATNLEMLGKNAETLPSLSRDAYQIYQSTKNVDPTLLYSHNDPNSTGMSQITEGVKDVPNIQQLRGGQSGDCYHTTFKDIASQIQYDYGDDDVRSISTFFLSLLILSNETNLELRPRVDDSNQAAMLARQQTKMDDVDFGNKDPLSLGYTFADFDVYVPLNARDTKRQQLQKASNQGQAGAMATASLVGEHNDKILPAKKRNGSLTVAPKSTPNAKKERKESKGKKTAKGKGKKGKKSKKEMDDYDDINTSDEESFSDNGSDSQEPSSDTDGDDSE
jgi:hypothetical protein